MLKTNNDKKNITVTMIFLLFGGFLSLFNETILNVAFSQMMIDLKVSASTIQWLSTGYVLVVAIMVPTTAFLLQTFTTKQLYVGAMCFFLIGTLLATASSDFPILLTARMIQAVGTGLLVPIMVNTTLCINPPEKHGFAMSLCIGAILVGPSLGPVVSGIMLQFFTWRALFLILIPLVILCIAGGSIFLHTAMEITKPKIDFLSIILSSIGFAFTVYGMSILRTSSSMQFTVFIFLIGFVSLLLFSHRQLHLKEPLLDISAFKKPFFSIGAILVIAIQMVQFSINVMLPMLLQGGLSCTSFIAAIVLLPAAVICCLTTLISGKIYDCIGGKKIIPLGLAIMIFALFALSQVQPSTSLVAISLINILLFFGISLAWSPDQSVALKQLPLEMQAHGVAIINTFIQLGAALGTPLFVGLMDAGQAKYLMSPSSSSQVNALYAGFQYSLACAMFIVAASFILSLFFSLEKE